MNPGTREPARKTTSPRTWPTSPQVVCPVEKHANAVLRAGRESLRAMRRLRRSLLNCMACPVYDQCEFLEQFNQQVDAVISELAETWGWGER